MARRRSLARAAVGTFALLALSAQAAEQGPFYRFKGDVRDIVTNPVTPPPPAEPDSVGITLNTAEIRAKVGKPFSFDFSDLAVLDNPAVPKSELRWSRYPADDSAWLSLNGTTGRAEGTPTEAGDVVIEVTASWKDSTGQEVYRIEVGERTLDAVMITGGSNFSCGLGPTGAVYCWGNGASGQLGNGSFASSLTPVPVTGLEAGVKSIEAGTSHVCAVTSTDGAVCWGAGANGRLGNDAMANSAVPVPVYGLGSGVESISAGEAHTCAVITGGTIKCWGAGASGRLGNNATADSDVPVDVRNILSGATVVTAGGSHTCAIVSGGAKCWGSGGNGRLGNDGTTASSVPVDVSDLGPGSGVTDIKNGNAFTCALVNTGVKCWGYGGNSQLGTGDTSDRDVPTDARELGAGSGVTRLSVAYSQACVVIGGAARCWGYNNRGQLGNGSTTNSPDPVLVYGLSTGVTAVWAGRDHHCATLSDGGAMCWGYNNAGQLGNGETGESHVPVDVMDSIDGGA